MSFSKPNQPTASESATNLDDIGNLVGDSFSDVPSDDSGNWMQKIDVSNFKQLTTAPDPTGDIKPELIVKLSPKESVPSPDSTNFCSPAAKKTRTSLESVDSLYDFSATTTEAIALAKQNPESSVKTYPKPIYSYSCLIALTLKNSKTGRLTVSEIYNFMCENFPYFKNAPSGWKNSVRHNLSLNKCFEKVEVETPGGHGRKSCLWMLNPAKKIKMDQEIKKWRDKDPDGVRESLANPEDLALIESGLKGMPGDFSGQIHFLQRLPDVVPNPSSSNLLLIQAAPSGLTPYGACGSQTVQTPLTAGSHSWPLTRGSLSAGAPVTPPPLSLQRSQDTLCSAKRFYSPPTFSTPASARSISINQSSPFAHTPPYSPNVYSPQLQLALDWTSSTPRQMGHMGMSRTQLAMHSPFSMTTVPISAMPDSPSMQLHAAQLGTHWSPYKCSNAPGVTTSGNVMMGPYETAVNALNNNSLLQSAMAQSPCCVSSAPSDLTLQRL